MKFIFLNFGSFFILSLEISNEISFHESPNRISRPGKENKISASFFSCSLEFIRASLDHDKVSSLIITITKYHNHYNIC